MSRSRKSVPIAGITTASSDKRYKQQEHRRERAAIRVAIASNDEIPASRAFGNPWNGDRDGKRYHPDGERILRK
jgi:hypothetical protein